MTLQTLHTQVSMPKVSTSVEVSVYSDHRGYEQAPVQEVVSLLPLLNCYDVIFLLGLQPHSLSSAHLSDFPTIRDCSTLYTQELLRVCQAASSSLCLTAAGLLRCPPSSATFHTQD